MWSNIIVAISIFGCWTQFLILYELSYLAMVKCISVTRPRMNIHSTQYNHTNCDSGTKQN